MSLVKYPYHYHHYLLPGDSKFPGNSLPVLHYKNVLSPGWFWEFKLKGLLRQHRWFRFQVQGFLTYNHYHSNAHEVLIVLKGHTNIQLGGDADVHIHINKGDVLLIPAGTAHKNLGDEHAVKCLSAYHNGRVPDINCGHPCERPIADRSIQQVALPSADPLFGKNGPLTAEWPRLAVAHKIYTKMHLQD